MYGQKLGRRDRPLEGTAGEAGFCRLQNPHCSMYWNLYILFIAIHYVLHCILPYAEHIQHLNFFIILYIYIVTELEAMGDRYLSQLFHRTKATNSRKRRLETLQLSYHQALDTIFPEAPSALQVLGSLRTAQGSHVAKIESNLLLCLYH